MWFHSLPVRAEVHPKPFFRAFATLRILKLESCWDGRCFTPTEAACHDASWCQVLKERYIGAFSSFKQILWQNRWALSASLVVWFRVNDRIGKWVENLSKKPPWKEMWQPFSSFLSITSKLLKLPRAVLSVTGGAAAVMWVLLKHCSGNELQLNPTLYAWPGDFQHPDVLRWEKQPGSWDGAALRAS